MKRTLSVVEVRRKFSEIIGRVAYAHERIIVERRGRPMVVIINLDDFERLEALDKDKRSNIEDIQRNDFRAYSLGVKGSLTREKIYEDLI
jgi:prevent-host-death family protein